LQELGKDVGRDGVGAEDQKGIEEAGMAGGAGALVAEIDYQETEREQQQAEAAGEENIGASPKLLVDGKREIPEASQEDGGESGGRDSVCLCSECALGAQPDTGEETEEGGGQSGNGAEEAFGIAGALVEVRGGEDLAVEPGSKIGVLVEEGDVAGGDAVSGGRGRSA